MKINVTLAIKSFVIKIILKKNNIVHKLSQTKIVTYMHVGLDPRQKKNCYMGKEKSQETYMFRCTMTT
jgi:hypothetical protein